MNNILVRHKQLVYRILNVMILILSVGLLIYLTVLGLRNVEFFSDRGYMTFQLWVCFAFIADFFIELYLSASRAAYVRRRLFFLVLSVPYLNIVAALDIPLTYGALYFLRFIPLARGALAMSIVVGYVSRNRLTNIFASYTVVLLAFIYMGSLIFYEVEHGHNPGVDNFWTALWWAFSVATTAGCDLYPVTWAGKIVCAVLPTMGTVLFPLFTVVVTTAVRNRIHREDATLRAGQTNGPLPAGEKSGVRNSQ
ncbi:MAG: ion transporter [Paramuribaculum sp.]|nr:ion transporter [Paramuribaculum sp.]